MKIKTICETNEEKFDNEVNKFIETKGIKVRATQTHVTSTPMADNCYDLIYTAVLYYEESDK